MTDTGGRLVNKTSKPDTKNSGPRQLFGRVKMINRLWDIEEVTIDAIACQADEFYGQGKADLFRIGGLGYERLGHSSSLERPDEPCGCWNSEEDTVDCAYMFGETILIQRHAFGKCPWKML